jgi:hypothetical protein
MSIVKINCLIFMIKETASIYDENVSCSHIVVPLKCNSTTHKTHTFMVIYGPNTKCPFVKTGHWQFVWLWPFLQVKHDSNWPFTLNPSDLGLHRSLNCICIYIYLYIYVRVLNITQAFNIAMIYIVDLSWYRFVNMSGIYRC